MNFNQLIDRLDQYSKPIQLDDLKAHLNELELDSSIIEEQLQFDDDGYQRVLLCRRDNYEILLLCFCAGQRTPIHDHAGSACGVKIVSGTGIETRYAATPEGWLFATGSNELKKGGVVGSEDMGTHQLSNLQPNQQTLVTLHIYSPPLGEVGNYSTIDNQVTFVKAASHQSADQ